MARCQAITLAACMALLPMIADARPGHRGLTTCLDDDTLAALLEDKLSPNELIDVRAHISECDVCRSLLAHAARSHADAGSSARDECETTAPVFMRSQPGAAGAAGAVEAGALLAGKYEVERLLGAGGMGYVVAARNVALDQRVAIKFLAPEIAHAPGATSRFLQEARAAARIESEHVVRVLDVSTLAAGATIIVMEYLDGRDLRAWLDEDGPLDPTQAVGLILEACVGLAHAHVVGIVHRDLKPANLFIAKRREGAVLKILDFGIAKIRHREGGHPAGHLTTAPEAVIGTPVYMSPEQVRSSAGVDTRADIWALGVILFELVMGYPPFRADTVTALAAKILEEPAPRLAVFSAPNSEQLAAIVARCLAKDPRQRFPTVGALADALASIATVEMRPLARRAQRVLEEGSERIRAAENVALITPTSTLPPVATSVPVRNVPPTKRRLVAMVVTLGMLMTLALGIARYQRSSFGKDRAIPVAAARPPAPSASSAPLPVALDESDAGTMLTTPPSALATAKVEKHPRVGRVTTAQAVAVTPAPPLSMASQASATATPRAVIPEFGQRK